MMTQSEKGPAGRNDALTIAALGFISYYTAIMLHEVMGHGLADYVFGARHFVLTSTSMSTPDPLWSADYVPRVVAAAGAVVNLLLGILFFCAFRCWRRSPSSPLLGFWLWLGTGINLSLAFMYPFYSGVFHVADWANVIKGLPCQELLRALEILVGAGGTLFTTRLLARHLTCFSGNRFSLTWIPYFSASAIACLAGLRVPDPRLIIMSVVPAALLGQIVLFLAPFLVRGRAHDADGVAAIGMNGTVLALALLCVVAIWFTAPGIAFSL